MGLPQLTVYQQGQGVVPASGLNTFAQVCQDLAQLRAFTGITPMQVYAQGISAPNDGGQGRVEPIDRRRR